MYNIHILDLNNGNVVAELKTEVKRIANDFIYDTMSTTWHGEEEWKIGLFDPDYGYYAMAIPHYENHLYEAFEIMALADDDIGLKGKYYCIPDAIDRMYDLLDE